MKLKCDVISYFNKDKIYGRAGDAVIIVNDKDFGDMVIIQTEDGNKFSTNKENLTTDFVLDTTKSTEIINKVSVSDTTIKTVRLLKKAKPNKQQSLF